MGLDYLELQGRTPVWDRGITGRRHGGRRGGGRNHRRECDARPVIRLPATLLCVQPGPHADAMFTVDEVTAEAIRIAFDRGGELSAVAELRRCAVIFR